MTAIDSSSAAVVRAIFAAIDGDDIPALVALMADDARFRFGNADVVKGKDGLTQVAQEFFGSVAAIRHHIHDLWEVGEGVVVTEMDVSYRRQDGGELTLPCCSIFRVDGGVVQDYRIYMDVNPVFGASAPSSGGAG